MLGPCHAVAQYARTYRDGVSRRRGHIGGRSAAGSPTWFLDSAKKFVYVFFLRFFSTTMTTTLKRKGQERHGQEVLVSYLYVFTVCSDFGVPYSTAAQHTPRSRPPHTSAAYMFTVVET